jgi:hypothetical protein
MKLRHLKYLIQEEIEKLKERKECPPGQIMTQHGCASVKPDRGRPPVSPVGNRPNQGGGGPVNINDVAELLTHKGFQTEVGQERIIFLFHAYCKIRYGWGSSYVIDNPDTYGHDGHCT